METLASQGFVILRGVLDPALAKGRDPALAKGRDPALAKGHDPALANAPDPARAVVEAPAILAVVQQIIGRAYGVLYTGLREPAQGRGRQGLHQDALRRPPGVASGVATVLFFLDDFGAENDATGLIPGSHLWPHALPKPQQQPLASHPKEIQVAGQAGDALIFDGSLWHRGRENHSGAPRRAIQVQFSALDQMPPSAGTILSES